jgi:hypothetical protein
MSARQWKQQAAEVSEIFVETYTEIKWSSEGVRQILLSAKVTRINVCWNLDKEGLGEASVLGSLRDEGTAVRRVGPDVLMESSQRQGQISRESVQILSRIWDSAGVIAVEGRRERVKGSKPVARFCESIVKCRLYEGFILSKDSGYYTDHILKNRKFLRILRTVYFCLVQILALQWDKLPAQHQLDALCNVDAVFLFEMVDFLTLCRFQIVKVIMIEAWIYVAPDGNSRVICIGHWGPLKITWHFFSRWAILYFQSSMLIKKHVLG